MNKIYIKLLVVFCMAVLFTSCGTINRFTRVKKIPRAYSLNYCGGEIKAPKTDINEEPWIVFSDREKNQTYNNPGGKVKYKDVAYLDPFLVIKKKGEYLRLIKYTPDVLKNGKLERKKAEYYGWMHKSKLLLNQQSVTDIASGKKNKMLVVFSDTLFIGEPKKYFNADSVKTYKDIEMNTLSGAAAPYSIVYRLKLSDNEDKTLISTKPYLKAETVKEDVLGWVDNTLIKDIGTGLHVNLSTIPDTLLQFTARGNETISTTEDISDMSQLLSLQYKTLQFNPVSSYSVQDSRVAFRTRKVLPLFDYSNNYIFNVKGEQISHKKFRSIVKNLRKINISIVFEGKAYTIEQFPQIVNALQNLQPVFELDNTFEYQFNYVMNFNDERKNEPVNSKLTSDYSAVINYLSDKVANKDNLKPITTNRKWASLRKAIDIFDDYRDATNLIILIGETGYAEESADSAITRKLLQNNCRIAAFQVYSDDGDAYTNFVLDVEQMICSYANSLIKKKQDILVSPEQVKRTNYYKETETAKNSYKLDFPDNSITQGFLFFPQKKSSLPMEFLANDIDSIFQQIKSDNNSIIRYASKAFNSFGNNRTLFDSLYVRNNHLSVQMPTKKLISAFQKETPGWYLPSKIVVLADSVNRKVDYRLMLSELEMNELKEFVKSLSSIEVDLKYQAEAKKANKKACDCPEDNLFLELESQTATNDSVLQEYANTAKVRKNLYNQYLKTIKYCKLCKEKAKKIKLLTFAQAQQQITGAPTNNEQLNTISLRDIKDKNKVTDKMLDELVNYFKSKTEELEKSEQFESNGEVYYWVDRKLLP
jgi:hypothetical protein